ncbi:hypothetical protein [Rhizorhapis sp.]|uniref:hypothetical protein n=1 Tax=Rhizorhapis sp. TaxID=1968842 RepID=UPI002B4AA19D|nr:hypothetical protein [Rhizorhapis sp.]HKR18127.1 hypothetical protein [Rhizorhapis sp.]
MAACSPQDVHPANILGRRKTPAFFCVGFPAEGISSSEEKKSRFDRYRAIGELQRSRLPRELAAMKNPFPGGEGISLSS